jgi:ketosteroid isomerase-like protein
MRRLVWTFGFVTAAAGGLAAQDHDRHMVTEAVEAFHAALTAGDSLGALALLAEDARIVENGNVQTRAEYRSGHLAADIRASASRPAREPSPITVIVHGDVAWTTSSSRSTRQVEDRTVTSSTAELMVLSRDGAGWKIRAIHWSSRSR